MNQGELKERMKQFALAIIGFTESLPRTRTADVLGGQLLRSGASVGANYRSACRAKSVADFISKMGIVEEEVDESMYWMELLIGAKVVEAKEQEMIRLLYISQFALCNSQLFVLVIPKSALCLLLT
jgi:four helix bundle protein